MARIVLVHGSGHGAWCWRDLVPLLTARGHEVRAPDLPAHGEDRTPRNEVTAQSYVDALLAESPPEGGTVLVGHSLAGMWITAAADAAPGRYSALVYVTAWAPTNGEAARDQREAAAADALLGAIERTPDGKATYFRDDALEPLFYHDCPAGTTAYARQHLCPEPLRPQVEPLNLTGRYLEVARHYIRCQRDRVIPPAAQRALSRDWPPGRVHDLACGHSPFFSNPDELADILLGIA